MTEGLVEWFRSLGREPERIGVSAPGFGRKMIGFKRAFPRLQRTGFNSVEGVTIDVQHAEANPAVNEWVIEGSWSVEYGDCVVAARESAAAILSAEFLQIAGALSDSIRPEYGVGYSREWYRGPSWYAMGIGYSVAGVPEEPREEPCFSRWIEGMRHRVYRHGFLRDVYPWNFLTHYQFERRIERTTLRRWIEADPARGTLTPMDDRVLHWSLTPEQIARVRPILIEKGFIFEAGPNKTPRGKDAL